MPKSAGGVDGQQPRQWQDDNDDKRKQTAHTTSGTHSIQPVQQENSIPNEQSKPQSKSIFDYQVQPLSPSQQLGQLPGVEKSWQLLSQYTSGYMFAQMLHNSREVTNGYQIVYQPNSATEDSFNVSKQSPYNALWQNQLNHLRSCQQDIMHGLLAAIEQQKQMLIVAAMNAGIQPSAPLIQQLMPQAFRPQICSINTLMNMTAPRAFGQQRRAEPQTPVTTNWVKARAMDASVMNLNNSSYAAESSLSCSNDAFNPAR